MKNTHSQQILIQSQPIQSTLTPTALELAVEQADLDSVIRLIPLSNPSDNDFGALYKAVLNINTDIVKILVPFFDPSKSKRRLLQKATSCNAPSILEALLPAYIDTVHNKDLDSSLNNAIHNNHLECVQILASRNIQISGHTVYKCVDNIKSLNLVLHLFSAEQIQEALIASSFHETDKDVIQTLLPKSDYHAAYNILSSKGFRCNLLGKCIYEYEALLQQQRLQESVDSIAPPFATNKRKI